MRHALGALIAGMVASTPVAAQEQGPWILPPAEFDYPHNQVHVVEKKSREEVRASCRAPMSMGLGCALWPTKEMCVIAVAPTDIIEAAGYTREVVIRHEIAHCNGWPRDHKGARKWHPKE